MRLIKAISIDPFECTVKEVEYDGDDHKNIYPLLSHPTHEVSAFDAARVDTLKGRDALFVDDEGLFKGTARWFQIAGGYQPFAGKGLIIGADSEGESQSYTTPLNLVRVSVIFLEAIDGHHLVQVRHPFESPKKD